MKVTVNGRTLVVGVVLVVAGAVGGGIAYATIPGPTGLIHGCYSEKDATQKNGAQLSVIDPSSAACKSNEAEVTWNQTGPSGADGADGVSVTSTPLGPGDPNCADGGSQFTAAENNVTYACNGAKGDQGDPGPSAAYANYGDGFHRIPDGGTQTVASVTVPAGSYTLTGVVNALDIDDFEFLQCFFVVPGVDVNGGFAIFVPGDRTETMLGDVTFPTSRSIFLRCFATDGAINARGQMIATKVGTVEQSL